jgi:uncharacterized RDD family membrane protein YckC
MKSKTNTLIIRTPEGVTFSFAIASPMCRCLAWSVDCMCMMVCVQVLGWVCLQLSFISSDLYGTVITLSYFIISMGYGMAMEWFWQGQTIGKKILRLRVVDREGFKLHVSQIIIRNLLRAVDSLPLFYFVGGIASLLNRHGQRLGDIAANTLVVRIPQLKEPDLEQIKSGKYNSFLNYPHLVARLRQRIGLEEIQLTIQALLRRDQLKLEDRVQLYSEIADHYRELVKFPEEAVQGISDEQYIRNVVEVLFVKKEKSLAVPPRIRPPTTGIADPMPS